MSCHVFQMQAKLRIKQILTTVRCIWRCWLNLSCQLTWQYFRRSVLHRRERRRIPVRLDDDAFAYHQCLFMRFGALLRLSF